MPLTLRIPKDGYTFKGKLEAKEGLWPEVNFSYRPALWSAYQDYQIASKRNGDESAVALSEFLVQYIGKWDAVDSDGSALPLTPAVLRECPIPALTILMEHVAGYMGKREAADAKN